VLLNLYTLGAERIMTLFCLLFYLPPAGVDAQEPVLSCSRTRYKSPNKEEK
jgi:hypothetical protein